MVRKRPMPWENAEANDAVRNRFLERGNRERRHEEEARGFLMAAMLTEPNSQALYRAVPRLLCQDLHFLEVLHKPVEIPLR
jgi:hypothetical protein